MTETAVTATVGRSPQGADGSARLAASGQAVRQVMPTPAQSA